MAPSNIRSGEVIDLSVTGLAFGGKGIAKVDDFVVFVDGAVPGDVVRARITKYKRRYAEARVLELLTASPDRTPHRCPSYGLCGGCVWQNLDYEVQLRYKASQVKESLEHLGGLHDFTMRPIRGMADPWRYRNRADFSIGITDGQAVVGFRPPGRWDTVLPLSECHLLDPVIERVRSTVEAWLRANDIPGWDPRTGIGFARHLLVRSAKNGAEVLASLVTVPADLPHRDDFVDRLRTRHQELVGVVHAVNGGRAEVSAGLPSTTLWGRPFLLETLGSVTLKVSVDAFFQTNTRMAGVLYGVVAEELRQTQGDDTTGSAAPVVWDLYSGVGSIALSLAGKTKAVLAVEAVPASIADAQENAGLNGIQNVTFVEGDVAKVLLEVTDGARELPEQVRRPDVVIVDPPRAGLAKKAVSRIGEIGAPRLVYVSCNPATMAPNVAQLGEYGYRLDHVTPLDMFPHTPHVEAVGLLMKDTD